MKPELLAPAGSIESFHAAVEAGADAVYLGLADFNARLRARNFTARTLAYILPFAHKHNVKIYVTLNTLVKQAELEPIVHTLYQLEQMGVDALIVTDRGVIDIARNHFPRLRLHASTQMTIHNSAGVCAAQRLGLKRAVLSRELTLEEIRSIRKQAAIELEVFVHGALCYSVSGLCLASSFLGGSSGNRGRCTQVCRRKFSVCQAGQACLSGLAGYCFSPRDLCAAPFIPFLKEIGVAGLKIEGRMKNAAYVYTVVNAYRKAIDGTISVDEAGDLLQHDLAREKSALFLDGVRQSGIITDAARSGVGELIGTVIEAGKDRITVASESACAQGDRIRIQPKSGFEGTAAVIRSVAYEPGVRHLQLKTAVECSTGDTVYLVGRHGEEARFDRKGVIGVVPVPFRERCPIVNKIMQNIASDSRGPGEGACAHGTSSPGSPNSPAWGRLKQGPRSPKTSMHVCAFSGTSSDVSRRDTLWVKIDTVDWLDHAANTPCQRLIFAGDLQETEMLLGDSARLKLWQSRLFIALPPFIPEHEVTGWQSLAGRFMEAGISRGVCSNISHPLIFPKGFEIVADSPLGCLNRASQGALQKTGFKGFIHPYEDDYLNIKASAAAKASAREIVCLFAVPQLFVSRIRPSVRPSAALIDAHGNVFITAEANGLFYLLSKEPFCFTRHRRKLSDAGLRDFLIDLSFCKADPAFLSRLVECYKNGVRLPDSSLFNFKAGLK